MINSHNLSENNNWITCVYHGQCLKFTSKAQLHMENKKLTDAKRHTHRIQTSTPHCSSFAVQNLISQN